MMRNTLLLAGIGAALLILARLVIWIVKKKARAQLFEPVVCSGCGWRGQVSRYAGRCPQCNQPLGEQKAKRP
jgi:predicted Zn-ribbon and HTH transcriptional regulator